MTSTAVAPSPTAPSTSPGRTRRVRATAVLAGAVGVVVVRAVAVHALGVDLSFAFGGGAAQTVMLPVVIAAGLVAPLAGWALLAVLERRFARGGSIWAAVAVVVLLASFALPVAATSVAAGLTLAVMHVVVAAAVVPAFWATSTRR